METQESNKIFSDIDNLYAKYIEVSLKKADADFKEKYAIALKTARDKLIIAVCRLYFKFENGIDSSKNISPVTLKNKNNDNYSDIVVIETINAMDTYTNNGYSFSQYVCMKINQARGKERSRKIASSNNGGRSISDYEAQQIRRVMKKDKELLKFGIYDESKRNEKLAKLLSNESHPMTVESIIHFKQLGNCNTSAIEGKNSDGETYSVIDLEKNLTEKHFITPESEYIINELKEQIPLLLNEMEKIFLKKPDKKTSELLAVSILEIFEPSRKQYIMNGSHLSDFYPLLRELISGYSCIDYEILTSFFTNPDYILPTRKNIADKYGLDKSAATQILSRFRVKLKEQETVKKYFPDFI